MTTTDLECKEYESTPCRCEVLRIHGHLEYHVNCSGRNLTEIPATLPWGLTILDFSHNQIRPDNLHTLCRYSNITVVSLAYNDLNELPAGQLRNCHISESVDFKGNVFNEISGDSLLSFEDVKIIFGLEAQKLEENAFIAFQNLQHLSLKLYQTEIPSNLFHTLNLKSLSLTVTGALQIPGDLLSFGSLSLTELHLEGTCLQRLPNKLLKHLLSIETISLKMKRMKKLPVELFRLRGKAKLKTVRISGVQSLPAGLFSTLKGLTRLVIHELTDVYLDLFTGLKLEYLDLTGSNTGHGKNLADLLFSLSTLKTLNVSRCSILQLEASSFRSLRSLENLNVANNEIKFLTKIPFKYIKNTVKEIILKGNWISTIEPSVFKGLIKLEILDLSENNIYALDKTTFDGLSNLKMLLIQRNKIASLPLELFQSLTNLRTLNMAYNIFEEEPGSMLATAINLEKLDLSDNHIKTISKLLVNNLVGLKVLNLEYNPLHCDCQLLQVTDALIFRGVHITAWCFTPSYQQLDKSLSENCKDFNILQIANSTSGSAATNKLREHGPTTEKPPTNPKTNPHQETYVSLNDQQKFYIALTFILLMAFFSILTLVCLALKNKNRLMYQMPVTRDNDFDKLGDPPRLVSIRNRNEPLGVLFEVPSVQIDVVDDDGRVSSETYAAADIPIMSN